MRNKNEIHINIDMNKLISSTDLSEALRKGQLIAAKISSINAKGINNQNVLHTNLSINRTSFLTPHLDIGGSGEAIIYKVSRNKLTIIDLNVDKEFENSRVEMFEMDASNLEFQDSKFLTITSFYTLMYVCYDDILSIFRECYRVLQNGGIMKIWDVYTTQIPSGLTNVSIDISCEKKMYHAEYSSNAIQEIRDQEFYSTLLKASGFNNVNINMQKNYVIIEAYKE